MQPSNAVAGSIWQRSDAAAFTGGEGYVVVLDMSNVGGSPAVLSGSALAIWEAVDGSRGFEDIVTLISEDFAVEAEQVRDDVRAFLDELVRLNLIHPARRVG